MRFGQVIENQWPSSGTDQLALPNATVRVYRVDGWALEASEGTRDAVAEAFGSSSQASLATASRRRTIALIKLKESRASLEKASHKNASTTRPLTSRVHKPASKPNCSSFHQTVMLYLSFDCKTITFRETKNNLIYDRDACMATDGGRKVLLTKETASLFWGT
jgi:hypothetical protein